MVQSAMAWRLKLYYLLLYDDEVIIEHSGQNGFEKFKPGCKPILNFNNHAESVPSLELSQAKLNRAELSQAELVT